MPSRADRLMVYSDEGMTFFDATSGRTTTAFADSALPELPQTGGGFLTLLFTRPAAQGGRDVITWESTAS